MYKPRSNHFIPLAECVLQGAAKAWKTKDRSLTAVVSYLVVALHGVNESLVSHNLCVSIQEALETVLGLLKLLLRYLRKEKEDGKLE